MTELKYLANETLEAYYYLDNVDDPEILDKLNKLLRKRTGPKRMQIEYSLEDGLTVFCANRKYVPVYFSHKASFIFELNNDLTELVCVKSRV